MAKFKCFFVSLWFCLCVADSAELLCEDGYCRSYQFDTGCTTPEPHCSINNATHTGLWLPSPTTCNCCEYCLPFYGEGEHCSAGGPGLGTTVGRCGFGLTCTAHASDGFHYCTRMETECHSKQDDYDARHASGTVGALEQRPLCDGKGKFAAFDCVPTQSCFCQSEDGERLFGEAIYQGSLQNMHCQCSRHHGKIKKNLVPGVPYPVVGPRCTGDGNFNPIQCIDRHCYCVDRITGVILEGTGRMISLDERPLSDLACYDAEFDLFPQYNEGEPPYNYTTPCFDTITERIDLVLESIEQGYNIDYFNSFPECLPDGTSGRIVINRNGTKICVDERGVQIENYHAEPNTPSFETMDCKCAQTSLIMASSNERPVCCANGNFRSIQCRRGMCRCVDADGRQTQLESSDVTTLSCYTPDWITC